MDQSGRFHRTPLSRRVQSGTVPTYIEYVCCMFLESGPVRRIPPDTPLWTPLPFLTPEESSPARPVRQDFPWVSEHYELSDITSLPKMVRRSKRKFKFWQSASSLSSLPSLVPMEFTTECKKYFYHYCTCSLSEISRLVATEIPQDRLPLAYLTASQWTTCQYAYEW